MTRGGAYYAGGARVLVDGVPIRVARKPSAANLAYLRAFERYRISERGDTPSERARNRARDANKAIEIYAETLEISLTQAKARINRQRNHLIANPLVDLSLEYDL